MHPIVGAAHCAALMLVFRLSYIRAAQWTAPTGAEKLPGHIPGSLIICLAEGDPFLGLADICPPGHIELAV